MERTETENSFQPIFMDSDRDVLDFKRNELPATTIFCKTLLGLASAGSSSRTLKSDE